MGYSPSSTTVGELRARIASKTTIPVAGLKLLNLKRKKRNDGVPNCGLLHDAMSLEWGKFKDLVDEL